MARVTRRERDKKNRAAIETDGGRALTTVAAPVPLPFKASEFVRMRHPTKPGTYYSTTTASWVTEGWTVWPIKDWRAKYGNQHEGDPRQWEFFGYRIPLYNDDDDGPNV